MATLTNQFQRTRLRRSGYGDVSHPDDHTIRTTDTPGFKPSTILNLLFDYVPIAVVVLCLSSQVLSEKQILLLTFRQTQTGFSLVLRTHPLLTALIASAIKSILTLSETHWLRYLNGYRILYINCETNFLLL